MKKAARATCAQSAMLVGLVSARNRLKVEKLEPKEAVISKVTASFQNFDLLLAI